MAFLFFEFVRKIVELDLTFNKYRKKLTLIIGYIHSDSTIHLIVDSAETIIETNNKDLSIQNRNLNSFGEIIEKKEDKIVFESAQKIYNISDSILVTFSGPVIEGNQVLQDLKLQIKVSNNTKKSEVISKYFDLRKPTLTEYIIAFSEENSPRIYYYKNEGTFLTETGSCVIMGSGSQNQLITMPLIHTLNEFHKIKSHPKNLLIYIISLVQCCALNALTFQNGVGGFINGATIFNNKIYWASDTCNILYSSKHFEKSERFFVNKFNRENVTFLTSPKINKAIYFPGLQWINFTPSEWHLKWVDKLSELDNQCNVDYFTFICYDRRIITVLNRNNDRFVKNLKFNASNPEKIEISDNLKEKILTYPKDPETNKESIDGYGVQFNII